MTFTFGFVLVLALALLLGTIGPQVAVDDTPPAVAPGTAPLELGKMPNWWLSAGDGIQMDDTNPLERYKVSDGVSITGGDIKVKPHNCWAKFTPSNLPTPADGLQVLMCFRISWFDDASNEVIAYRTAIRVNILVTYVRFGWSPGVPLYWQAAYAVCNLAGRRRGVFSARANFTPTWAPAALPTVNVPTISTDTIPSWKATDPVNPVETIKAF